MLGDIVNSEFLKLGKHLQEIGFQNGLPTQKYIDTVDKEEWEKDKRAYPSGIRDFRGENNLYPLMSIHMGQNELDISFIGTGHVPYFHEQFVKSGLNPYVISNHQFTNPVPYESLLLLRYLRQYPAISSEGGKPIIIIGHNHFEEYNAQFPNPEDLMRFGISKVYIHAEFVTWQDSEESRLRQLEKLTEDFQGFKMLVRYITKLKSIVEVRLEGLEPISG